MADAIVAGGGHIVPLAEAEALVWAAPRDPEALRWALAEAPHLSWVQLPFAGIETFVDLVDEDRVWTCGKGVYAEPVAELALSLALAGMRHLGGYARATQWGRPHGRNLIGSNVTILGGGGITEVLLQLLAPFNCHITVVRNRVEPMEGADDVVEADRYVDALAGADVVFLALALTPETEGMISRSELEQMSPHTWLVNVARGRHIVTDDLVWALQHERHRWRCARRHRPRAAAARAPAVDAAELHHHPPRRQHAGDGRPPAVGAHRHQRSPLRPR
jgi:phosphoglycerate dehydrogenase-like enzyme